MSDQLDIPAPGGRASGLYRVSRPSSGMDPALRRGLIIAGVGCAVVAFGALGWSTLRPHSTTIPVIEADSRPIKVKPENAGGIQVEDDAILSGSSEGNERLAPPTEAPDPGLLKRQQDADAEAAKAAAVKAAAAAKAAAAPVAMAPPAPAVVAPPPAAVPAPEPAVVASAPPAAPAPAAAKPHAVAHESAFPIVPGGHVQVQLAAMATEALAITEWTRLQQKFPDLLSGRKPDIKRYEHDGQVFYRLRTGGFGDVANAKEFCSQLTAKKAGCSVASF